MSITYKLNRICPICGTKISDKNKSGFCNRHRDRTGKNNPFFGKHHSKETVEQIKKTCAVRTHELWQNEDYRNHVIDGATGLKRSDEFKELQRQHALEQFEDPEQREIRAKRMRQSWIDGVIHKNEHYSPNFSKEQIQFGEELQKLLGDKADKLEFHATINYDESKWLFPDFRFNNFIIEYNGTFWHADPKKFNADDIVHHEIKAKEIWERDENRRSIFKKLGYILIEVWSDDYKANKEQVLNEIVRKIL